MVPDSTPTDPSVWVLVPEMAARLGKSTTTVQELLRAGHLPGFRLGKTGCWYVLRCEFDRFLREGRWWLGERELAQRIEAAIAKGAEAAWRGAEVRFGPAQPEPAGYRVVREVRKGASR